MSGTLIIFPGNFHFHLLRSSLDTSPLHIFFCKYNSGGSSLSPFATLFFGISDPDIWTKKFSHLLFSFAVNDGAFFHVMVFAFCLLWSSPFPYKTWSEETRRPPHGPRDARTCKKNLQRSGKKEGIPEGNRWRRQVNTSNLCNYFSLWNKTVRERRNKIRELRFGWKCFFLGVWNASV